ncbi:facilitated trehalose transporter Tret1-2 homolog [Penaeus japonicus]|uniref:facilitated trehalose transporter Tret1-2 homolog n=1 Tax=Penaeus japonicus TaxID=27405 RepID=UPI001C7143B5|nr:facilitated trehalose transporter Tret1-2 homolog [Penaeus japonicus]
MLDDTVCNISMRFGVATSIGLAHSSRILRRVKISPPERRLESPTRGGARGGCEGIRGHRHSDVWSGEYQAELDSHKHLPLPDDFDTRVANRETELQSPSREGEGPRHSSGDRWQDKVTAQKGPLNDEAQPKVTRQMVAALMMSLSHLAIGTIYGYPGVTLPELTDPGTPDLFLDTTQAANFGSLADLGGFFGSVLGIILLLKFGQRVSLLVGLPVAAGAWCVLAFSQTAETIQAMRFMVGLIGSFMLPAGSMYMLEVSHKKLRGLLFGIVTTSRQAGVLFVYAVGSLGLGWRNTGLVCAGVTLVPVVGLLFLPNSPRWLVTQGRVDEAQKALTFYRGKLYDWVHEMSAITDQVGQDAQQNNGFLAQLRLMRDPSSLRTLALLIFISLLCNFSGYIVIVAYVVPILQSANVNLDAYISAIVVGAARVAGTLVHLAVVDKMGRKPLLTSSYTFCAICMAVLGGFFYVRANFGFEYVKHLGWMPLTALVIFIFFTGVGQPVVFILQGELLPTSFRATGVSVIMILVFLGSFAAIRTYSLMSALVGEHGAFWFYGGMCLTIALVGCLALPETSGRSLEEITGKQRQRLRKITENSQNMDAPSSKV